MNMRMVRAGVSIAALTAASAAWGQAATPGAQSFEAAKAPAPAEAAAQIEGPVPAASDVAAPVDVSVADIVVTAQRRAQRLQDVPMSINVATGQQLQRLQILDVKDIAQLAPGLDLTNTVGRNNTATLRGVAYDPDSGSTPAVDLYFNEVPIDAQTGFTAIYDIDQIEVLRGPQGALRGRTSPAGAITIRTRRPQFNVTEGYAQATGTDQNAFNVQGGVTLPLVSDTLSMRVAGLVDGNRINDVKNISRNGEYSRSRTVSGRFSVAWKPASNINVNLMYQYLNADNSQNQQVFGPGNPAIGNPPISLGDRLAVHEGKYRSINNSNFVTLDADWDLGPVTLNLVGGRQDSHTYTAVANDVGNAIHGYEATTVVSAPIGITTAEVRLVSNGNGFFNWTVGGYYSRPDRSSAHVAIASDFIGGIPGVPIPVAIVPLPGNLLVQGGSRTLAANGSVRLRFTDKLTLEAAARYTDFRADQVDTLTIKAANLVLPLLNSKQNSKPLTGTASLSYKVSPDLTVYAAYGRSYRPPSYLVGPPQNISENLKVSKQETSNSFEAGAKFSFFDHRLSFDGDVFYQKFKNYIFRVNNIGLDQGTNSDVTGDGVPDGVYLGPPDGAIDTVGAFTYNGDATTKGVEGTLTGRPTSNWDLSISASYVKARFNNALIPCTTLNASGTPVVIPNAAFGGINNVSYCKTSRRLADQPDFTLTANTEIRFPIGDYQPFIRGLVNYRPSVYSEVSDYRYPQRDMVNLFIGVRGPGNKWEASLFAKNILNQDKLFATNINNAQYNGTNLLGGAAVVYDSGYRFANLTNPREIGGSVSIKW